MADKPKWTLGPEHKESEGKSWLYYSSQREIISPDGDHVACVSTCDGDDLARRVVAALNHCGDFSTEIIEGLKDGTGGLIQNVFDLTQQLHDSRELVDDLIGSIEDLARHRPDVLNIVAELKEALKDE